MNLLFCMKLSSFILWAGLPEWALLVFIAFLLLTIFYILFKFITRLGNEWANSLAAFINVRLREAFSGHTLHYRQHLMYAHRNMDVKGLATQGIYTLELARIFVELSIVPQAPHQATQDPLYTLPKHLCQGQRLIWDYLLAPTLADQHFVIIGPPGSGKTTLLKHMALALIAPPGKRRQAHLPNKLPMLIFLCDLVPFLTVKASIMPKNGLPPDIFNQLCNTLLKCDAFNSDQSLRNYFTDARLAPWRDRLPRSSTRTERVRTIINQLYDANTNQGDNVLIDSPEKRLSITSNMV